MHKPAKAANKIVFRTLKWNRNITNVVNAIKISIWGENVSGEKKKEDKERLVSGENSVEAAIVTSTE